MAEMSLTEDNIVHCSEENEVTPNIHKPMHNVLLAFRVWCESACGV